MDKYELECLECGWLGFETELVSKTDNPNDKDFVYCPECGSDEDVVDIENDEI